MVTMNTVRLLYVPELGMDVGFSALSSMSPWLTGTYLAVDIIAAWKGHLHRLYDLREVSNFEGCDLRKLGCARLPWETNPFSNGN